MHTQSLTVSAEAERLKERALSWLETMRLPGTVGQYRLNRGADASVFSSCFAVFLRRLLGDLDTSDSAERQAWLSWLLDFQDPESGLFIDRQNAERAPDQDHDDEHLNRQLTTFCLGAVHALGGRPRYPLRFLEAWKSPGKIAGWLDGLNWKNPWNSGNKAMFMGIFLAYDWEHTRDHGTQRALDAWFAWHDRHQRPDSGFWGEGRRADFIDGMGGAYHQYTVYHYMGRPLPYPERIVDRTLLLQQPDAMYSPYQGGATCYEMDAVDILVHCYRNHDYRRADICSALRRMLPAVLSTQNPDGGFCWGRRRPFTPAGYVGLAASIARHRSLVYWYQSWRAAAAIQIRRRPQLKTGWVPQPRDWDESSVFDTWFRCLTVAEISQVIQDSPYATLNWQYLTVPGLGWFPQ